MKFTQRLEGTVRACPVHRMHTEMTGLHEHPVKNRENQCGKCPETEKHKPPVP